MTVQAWVIFTSVEAGAAMLLNDENQSVIPREIDNVLANNIGEGTLVGKYVAPARLLNDPDYERWVDTVGLLPIRTMDSEVLFLPPPEEEEV